MGRSEPTVREAIRRLTDPSRRVTPEDLAGLADSRMPGVYAWFVDDAGAQELASGLGLDVEPGLIYAGQAGAGRSAATLGSRIRRNHLGGNIYASTFRLTLTSVLRGSLALAPLGGRRMQPAGETRLTAWIRGHLEVAVVAYPDRARLDDFETHVLETLDPAFNLAKRPPTPVRLRLTQLRGPFERTRLEGPSGGRRRRAVAGAGEPTARPAAGPTPEDLARELGLPNAKAVRAFLRRRFPRPESELWSRWGPLSPELETAVRTHFGAARRRRAERA